MRDTDYAELVAEAVIGESRIERIHIKAVQQVEIRFSYWKDDKFVVRPLDLPEEELLPLFIEAMRKGVFTAEFLRNLHSALYEHQTEVVDAART